MYCSVQPADLKPMEGVGVLHLHLGRDFVGMLNCLTMLTFGVICDGFTEFSCLILHSIVMTSLNS
jgi:hypothetical protein